MKVKNKLKQDNIFCPECRTIISLQEIICERKVKLDSFYCVSCGRKIDLKEYNLLRPVKVNKFTKENREESKDIMLVFNDFKIFSDPLKNLISDYCIHQ